MAFRLWQLGALIWVALVMAAEWPSIDKAARAHAQARDIAAGRASASAFPLMCPGARGLAYVDYRIARAGPGDGLYCIYDPARFRRLYPEYRDVSDAVLHVATWEKTGAPADVSAAKRTLHGELAGAALEAVGPPALAAAALLALRWWMLGGGSRPPRRVPKAMRAAP